MSTQKMDYIFESDVSNNIDSLSTDTDIINTNTLAILNGPLNSKVYLVGTAHFSRESQNEVIELIRKVKPNRVVLELCNSRINLLKLDEETVLKEAREMSLSKMIQIVKQVFINLFE
jgi:pheromone shutdown protein TraB